jgi:hypothetical protein
LGQLNPKLVLDSGNSEHKKNQVFEKIWSQVGIMRHRTLCVGRSTKRPFWIRKGKVWECGGKVMKTFPCVTKEENMSYKVFIYPIVERGVSFDSFQ